MEQDIKQTTPEMPESPKVEFIWTLVGIAVVAAGLAGGGVFWWQKSAGEKMRNDAVEAVRQEMQSQIDALESQIEGLGEGLSAEASAEAETEDWQTYRNEEYGYEFKYPNVQFNKPISFQDSGNPLGMSSINYDIDYDSGLITGADMNVFVYDLETGKNLENDGITEIDYNKTSSENLIFLNLAATTFKGQSKTGDYTGIIITDEDSIISIYLRYEKENDEYLETFNQILSTFKFID